MEYLKIYVNLLRHTASSQAAFRIWGVSLRIRWKNGNGKWL